MKECEWKAVLVDTEKENVVKKALRFFPCKGFDGRVFNDEGGSFRCDICGADIRKSETKQPSHSEIWSKCWKNGDVWIRVTAYENGLYWIFDKDGDDDKNEFTSVGREWFIGVESRDIPPEGE